MKKICINLSLIALLITSTSSVANTPCLGTINYLGLNDVGTVYVSLNTPTNITTICNVVSKGSFAMSVDSCKLAYATLLSTRMLGKRVTLWYQPDNLVCSSFPNWGVRYDAYFRHPS